jgi:hypothetical protein
MGFNARVLDEIFSKVIIYPFLMGYLQAKQNTKKNK